MIFLLATAFAAEPLPELALVPLDASPGTAQAGLERALRGIASAVQAEGGVIAVYDTDLVSRFGSRAEEALASGRDNLSEGRRLMQEGDPELAVAFLEQAVQAHEDAGSDVIRRTEAADAHYALGRAYLASYKRDEAKAEFRRAIVLVPDFMDTRADALNDEIRTLADEATAALATRPPRKLSPEGGAELERRLGVTCLVYGTVDMEGDLALYVQNGPAVEYVVERPGPFEAPAVGDRWYADIAMQVVPACRGEAVPPWVPPVETVDDPDGPDPIRNNPGPTVRKRTAVTATVVSVLLLGAAGAGTAYYVWPDAGTAPPTWNVTVTAP